MSVWLHLKIEQVGKGQERKKVNIVVPFEASMALFEATIG